ncbi:MAG: hypothetical protein COC19_06780 [SAR86 cluster bacterium]|uniref:Uncharacterized protein n=1 Tax=SAR86 cluster bacterium TaxID=2030880 RepID=A0A2A4MJB1_9GAMM|nr:MAG: hypothetical protein COC19_06780 [SAR86 cluster bacterium]
MIKTPTLYPTWPQRLVFSFAYGKICAGALIFTCLWFMLTLLDDTMGFYLKLFFVSIIAYIIPIYAHIIERSVIAFDEIAPALECSREQTQQWRIKLTHRSGRWFVLVTLAAVIMWLLHISLMELYTPDVPFSLFNNREYSIKISAFLVWLALITVSSALIGNAFVLAQLGQRLAIDLICTSAHMILGRIAILSILSFIGAESLFVLLVMDSSPWTAVAPGIITLLISMFCLFIIPVWPVHKRLVQAKNEQLSSIEIQLLVLRKNNCTTSLPGEKLQQLNQLLLYRREIRQAPVWPFDLAALTRLGLYLILPPLTWVGAALIENVVDTFVQ